MTAIMFILNYIAMSGLALLLGYILDLILGDPQGWWHPVRGIGWFITVFETWLRRAICRERPEGAPSPGMRETSSSGMEKARGKKQKNSRELTAGILLVILALAVSVLIPAALIMLAYRVHPAAGFILEILMCYSLLATKSLRVESMKVCEALEKQGLDEGKRAVSMIVGRDTEDLTEAGVIKAAVETVAENACDGVVAPMFYMAIGGPVLGFFYKAVNTMDSMVGYKNDRYLYFGRAAARLDDVMNFIPARLCAVFMMAVAGLCGGSGKEAVRIFLRDRKNHASPNAAQTEAVMAGALQIRLGGDASYFGRLHKKMAIGDDVRKPRTSDIRRANRILFGTSVFGMIVFFAVKLLLRVLIKG